MTTTPTNGHQPTANSDLPDIRPQASPPAVSETTADATPTVAAYPVPPPAPFNLADDWRQKRLERQNRQRLVSASFRYTERVSHPDGGDCLVEEILTHE